MIHNYMTPAQKQEMLVAIGYTVDIATDTATKGGISQGIDDAVNHEFWSRIIEFTFKKIVK